MEMFSPPPSSYVPHFREHEPCNNDSRRHQEIKAGLEPNGVWLEQIGEMTKREERSPQEVNHALSQVDSKQVVPQVRYYVLHGFGLKRFEGCVLQQINEHCFLKHCGQLNTVRLHFYNILSGLSCKEWF